MPAKRGSLRALLLSSMLITTSAIAVRPDVLFKRDGTCASGFNKCPQAGLPSGFCCGSGSTCILLAGNTTLLCCPTGQSCTTIKRIPCDISLQDATKNPAADLKTSALTSNMTKCADSCCPFGYTCDGDGNCEQNADQSQPPPVASGVASSGVSTTTAASSAGSTSTPATTTSKVTSASPSGTTNPSTSSDSAASPSPTASSNSSSTSAIVGGVVGGVVFLICLIAVIMVVCHRRRQLEQRQEKESRQRQGSDVSFVGDKLDNTRPEISTPQPDPNYPNTRVDFILKSNNSSPNHKAGGSVRTSHSSAASGSPSQGGGNGGFNSNLAPVLRLPHFSIASSEASVPRRSYHNSAEIPPIRSMRRSRLGLPATPRPARRQNSGGSESINIFADPDTVSSAGNTPRNRGVSAVTVWPDFSSGGGPGAAERPVPMPSPRRT